jgi:uncharacterized protein DUF4262
MTRAQLLRDIANDIREHGRSVLCIPGDADGSGFAYTIGNWETHRLPELLIIGTTRGAMLNPLSELMIERDHAFAEGEIVDLGGKYPVKIITANERAQTDYTIQAGQFLGHESQGIVSKKR